MTSRLHPKLWEEIQSKWYKGTKGGLAGKWNARKAQLAVQEYKRVSRERFGDDGYRGKKPRNALVKWTEEDWGYAGAKGKSRYLPKKVREALPKKVLEAENKKKGKKLGKHVPYGDALKKEMQKAGVLKGKKK